MQKRHSATDAKTPRDNLSGPVALDIVPEIQAPK